MVKKIKVKRKNKKLLKIKAYEFTNPLLSGTNLIEGRYNHDMMDRFFKSIMLLDIDKRKYKNDEVTLNLTQYNQSYNINIMEGSFFTARYGIRRSNIDIESQQEINYIEPHQGVKNEFYFTLDKKNRLAFSRGR